MLRFSWKLCDKTPHNLSRNMYTKFRGNALIHGRKSDGEAKLRAEVGGSSSERFLEQKHLYVRRRVHTSFEISVRPDDVIS